MVQMNRPEGNAESSNDSVLGADVADLPKIPEELAYLLEPAIRFNMYLFEDQIQAFLENGDEKEFEMLASLAERARLAGHYAQVMSWMDEICEVIDRIVDKRHPYSPTISRQQEMYYLSCINPELSEKAKSRAVRLDAEADDPSHVASVRRKLRRELQSEANLKVHDFDVYNLFGLMGACGLDFE